MDFLLVAFELSPQTTLLLLAIGFVLFVTGAIVLLATAGLTRVALVAGWTLIGAGLVSMCASFLAGVIPQMRRPPPEQEVRDWKDRFLAERARSDAAEAQFLTTKRIADRVDMVSADLSRTRQDVDRLTSQLNEKAKQIRELQSEQRALSEKHATLTNANSTLMKEHADLNTERFALLARISSLQGRLVRLLSTSTRYSRMLGYRLAAQRRRLAAVQNQLGIVQTKLASLVCREQPPTNGSAASDECKELRAAAPDDFDEDEWAKRASTGDLALLRLPMDQIVSGLEGNHYRLVPNNERAMQAYQYLKVLPTFAPHLDVIQQAFDAFIRSTVIPAAKHRQVYFLVRGEADEREIKGAPPPESVTLIPVRPLHQKSGLTYAAKPSPKPFTIPSPMRNTHLPNLRAFHTADTLQAALERAGLKNLQDRILVLGVEPEGTQRKIIPEIIIAVKRPGI